MTTTAGPGGGADRTRRVPPRARAALLLAAAAAFSAPGCPAGENRTPPSADAAAPPSAAASAAAPRLLFLPDADVGPPSSLPRPVGVPPPTGGAPGRCPAEMVLVDGSFCIDRWEASLVDTAQGRAVSPYYPPSRKLAVRAWERWRTRRHDVGNARARAMALPELEGWQTTEEWEPVARSRPGVVPNGYVSGDVAKAACARAGKRLCREPEWRVACGGEGRTRFPYGDAWDPTGCNVFREAHPAAVLHDDASIEHSDPRLNVVAARGKALLRKTGETERCTSRWGTDAIFDMVGNLDEWIDDDEGVFVGGFYSRSTRSGCDARVSAHPRGYYDYSLGFRCCK